MRSSLLGISLFFSLPGMAIAQSLPVGQLSHDGPATPEQIALLVPVTGSLADSATATVRYKRSSSSSWTEGHALFRIRPNFSTSPAVGSVSDDFAWTIIDLQPGTSYDVEVTVSDGSALVTRNATFRTRALPPAAGAPNKRISAGASSSEIQSAFNSLQPGDVLQFENGEYAVNDLEITRSGTSNDPIYIRGGNRDNVVLRANDGHLLRIIEADNVIVENMTLQGSGTDGGDYDWQAGIWCGGFGEGSVRNTLRNLTIRGVDRGVVAYDELREALVYNNTLIGNNVWTVAFLSDNRTWDDDGINLPGFGNVAFNNTLSGFGDSFAYAQHVGSDTLTQTAGVHYYRNEIRNTLDDLVEVDHGHRNMTFYDNRSHNSSNCSSLDPLYGGPFIYARNICINPARTQLHKWNDTNTGQFLLNNTFISAKSAVGYDQDSSAWYQPNNGSQRAYGFRNNLIVYRGDGNTLWLESSGHDVIDWTHNSWYPNRQIQWDGVYSNLAQAQSSLGNTQPIFSGTSRRMNMDNITVSNPWTTQVVLGADSRTEVTQTFTPVLSSGSSPSGSGAVIPNITDGFSGSGPDRGALIAGRSQPTWGDTNAAPPPAVAKPKAPDNLRAD